MRHEWPLRHGADATRGAQLATRETLPAADATRGPRGRHPSARRTQGIRSRPLGAHPGSRPPKVQLCTLSCPKPGHNCTIATATRHEWPLRHCADATRGAQLATHETLPAADATRGPRGRHPSARRTPGIRSRPLGRPPGVAPAESTVVHAFWAKTGSQLHYRRRSAPRVATSTRRRRHQGRPTGHPREAPAERAHPPRRPPYARSGRRRCSITLATARPMPGTQSASPTQVGER